MKANELRIGNFIIESLSFGSDKVIKIDPNIFNRRIDEFIPIPLTEEWLLKFGFEIGYNQKKMLDVYCKDCDFLIERSNSNNFYYKKVNIKSVHQLQNLYFALTEEEITFKSEQDENSNTTSN